jgi:hypothetical protein
MICFDVGLNGSRVCRAGVGRRGVLHACAGWVNRGRGQVGPGTPRKVSLSLDVGGMAFRGAEAYEHVTWRGRRLRPGDEVTIRVMEAPSSDRAASRYREPKIPRIKLVLGLLRDAAGMLGSIRGQRSALLQKELRSLAQKYATRRARSRITRR